MLNIVAIMGRLVRDPELRTTGNGTCVTNFTIACERRYVRKGEEREADFINVVAWRQTAEFVCKYFEKGSLIVVDGSLQSRRYQDKDGNDRTAIEIVANNINFAGSKNKDTDGGRQAAQPFKSAQTAPDNVAPQAQGMDADDDFVLLNDADDLPF